MVQLCLQKVVLRMIKRGQINRSIRRFGKATNETYISGQLYLINFNELLPDPDQPRKFMDPAALTEMVDSFPYSRNQG